MMEPSQAFQPSDPPLWVMIGLGVLVLLFICVMGYAAFDLIRYSRATTRMMQNNQKEVNCNG